MTEQEKKERADKIALFKFSMISPVLYEQEESQNQYFKRMADKEFLVPGIGMKKFSISTFKAWLSTYRRRGYDGIKPGNRKDRGISRKISPKFKDLVIHTLKELPITTYSMLYRHLTQEGFIKPDEFTMQTFIKYLKDNQISIRQREVIPRKKFETRYINQLWICDFMHSIYIRDGKKKRQTFLCAIIDDHSRVITGYFWSFDSSVATLEETIKNAIFTYGLPEKFYCDNGKVFLSDAIHKPFAKLGVSLIHSKPYDPPSRGKIERFFRTVQMCFIPTIDSDKTSLLTLNNSFSDWINSDYHKKIHQGMGEPPMERYLKDLNKISPKRLSKENLELVFYRTIKRNVRQDCTVSVNGKLYEAPPRYIGLQVELRYSSSSPDELFIFQDDKPLDKLRLLDIHQNASPPHISLSYSELFNTKE